MDKQDKIERLVINDVTYVREDSVLHVAPNGKRAVVVVDRGWIYAGDVVEENGRIRLKRAVWCFGWKVDGFLGLLDNPKKHDVRKMKHDVDMPKEAEIFRIPVSDDWGL
jgi:hypothetical protein